MVKPSNKCSGQGIIILNSLDDISLKEYVLTKYITNVNLINGKKYDLRLYVLISGLKPLRIYFYKEGFARIAAEKYNLEERSIKNKFVHFTNIDVNINNKKFIMPNTIRDKNANKSIISVYQNLTEEIERQNVSDQSFYNLLGYDILINDKFEPILLEINSNPYMNIFNEIEKPIKTNAFIDALNLVGIIPYSRRSKMPLNNKFKFNTEVEDNVKNAFCEFERPRGDYELIFPKRENINIYKKYFLYNTEENKKFWNKIVSLI